MAMGREEEGRKRKPALVCVTEAPAAKRMSLIGEITEIAESEEWSQICEETGLDIVSLLATKITSRKNDYKVGWFQTRNR